MTDYTEKHHNKIGKISLTHPVIINKFDQLFKKQQEEIMYRLISILFFTAFYFLNTEAASSYEAKNKNANESFDKLLSEVSSLPGNNSVQPDLTDFRTKAENGMNTIYPVNRINFVRCEKISNFSVSISESLQNYFEELYENDLLKMEPGWSGKIISEFEFKQARIGIMQWEILINGITFNIKSVSVFDKSWNVLFDTRLVNLFYCTESADKSERDYNSQNSTASILSINSQTKSRLLNLNGTFGSVQLSYQAKITAEVDSYITASTNDAEYNYYTNYITCERINPSGIPPNAEPFIYFGTLGEYALIYQNSEPCESPITITGGSGDRFNAGLYNISGENGLNWSFSFDFSVDVPGGGIGITPQSNISSLSLNAINNSSINMLNYLYNHNVATGDVRAVFFDGGSLNANNFKVKTNSGEGETGKIKLVSKLRAGYMAPNISGTLVPNFWNETSAGFNFYVYYLRGDHVLQPDFILSSTRYNIPIGQIDTLKAKIINNSHAVGLSGGNISIDVSSLNNKLTLLSAATLSIGTIDTSASKEFRFVVRGNENGIVTPQVNISAMGWESPVPPSVLINNITSIYTNIDVSPLEKTLTLTIPLQGFYNAVTNSMNRDTAQVYLRNSVSPYAVEDYAKAYLSTSGTGTFSFSNAINFNQYYIQTKHRNSIETWSKTTQFFINSFLTYDFSTINTQAYGDNLIQVDASPVLYAAYSGDVNQDGVIDGSDALLIDNDAANFSTGYFVTDLNGDEVIDGSDAVIADNNAANFITAITP